jgi:5-methylcytosine-specific restriction endonuclease McrA
MKDLSQYAQARHQYTFFAVYGDFPHPCWFCGEDVDGHVHPRDRTSAIIHHVDHDKRNGTAENLVPAHHGCHMAYHGSSTTTQARKRERMTGVNAGRVLSLETRKKMSVAAKGKPKSVIHRLNIAKARKGLPSPFHGSHSSEAKAKMREAYARRPLVECSVCGKEMTTNNLARHLKSHERSVKRPRVINALTFEQKAEIRTKYVLGGVNQTDLAREYGVSQPYVSGIVRGKK